MENLVLYLLVVLLQGQGPTGLIFGDKAGCEELRADIVKRSEVLAASKCLDIPMEKTLKPNL